MTFLDYLNDHPSCRMATQAEQLTGILYREGKGDSAFQHLLRAIRKGDVVRVYRPFLLAPAHGRPSKKRRVWTERHEAIKARGGSVVSIDPPLKGIKLAMQAYEEIAGVARGRAGKGRQGRPKKVYDDTAIRVIERYWPPRKGWTGKKALDAINSLIAPKRVTRGYLYSKYPVRAD